MYLTTIIENYCLNTIKLLLDVYDIKLLYKLKRWDNKIEIAFYSYDLLFVYTLVICFNDDYIPNPDVLAFRIYSKFNEIRSENNE